MALYEFDVKCAVKKLVTVDAKNEEEAVDKVNAMNWIDDREISMTDWDITSGPREI